MERKRFQVFGGETWCPDRIVLLDTWSNKLVCEYVASPYKDRMSNIERREVEGRESEWASWFGVIATMLNESAKRSVVLPFTLDELVGKHVRLVQQVERFDAGIAEKGLTGKITEADQYNIYVKLDQHLEWLDEWDNCLMFSPDQCPTEFQNSVEFIDAPEKRKARRAFVVIDRKVADDECECDRCLTTHIYEMLHGESRLGVDDTHTITSIEEVGDE